MCVCLAARRVGQLINVVVPAGVMAGQVFSVVEVVPAGGQAAVGVLVAEYVP